MSAANVAKMQLEGVRAVCGKDTSLVRQTALALCIAFASLFLAIWTFRVPAAAHTALTHPQPEALPKPGETPRYLGSGSCAAAACHGGDDPARSWRSAHTTWIT